MFKLGLIPARYGSTRFPGKPLAKINGIPMVMRVFEQCRKADLDMVAVVTDHDEIMEVVLRSGGNSVMTPEDIPSGTDRCRYALDFIPTKPDIIVNIQGDEPFIDPEQINQVLRILESNQAEIATLVSPARSMEEVENPNRVKAVTARDGKALYFSRHAIPYPRNSDGLRPEDYLIHLGLYGFSYSALRKTGDIEPGILEMTEGLEQLRWLENGMSIYTDVTDNRTDSVDTPEDLRALEKKFFL